MIAVADQPRRYGSTVRASTRALVTMLKGPTVDDPTVSRWWFFCAGNRSHYHPETGTCVHAEEMAARMKPWYLARTWYLPFGDIDREYRRLRPAVQGRMRRHLALGDQAA